MNQLLKRGDKPQREPSSAQQGQRTDPVKAARIILKRDRLGSAMIHVTECVEILKRVSFIAGQRSDYMKALDLIDGQKMSALIADKGYHAHDMVDAAKGVHTEAVIPPRSQRRIPREYNQE